MRSVIVTSQKGGAGKTTLALNLGVAAAQAGQKVCLVDLDPQQSLRGWWSAREADAPAMLDKDPSPSELIAALPKLAKAFDVLVIDTPPAAADWLEEIMRHIDLVLVPVRPSPHDLRAVGATLRTVKAAGAEFAFVVSAAPRAKLTDQAARTLARHGKVAPVNIAQRIVYAETAATGQGAVETGDKRASEEINALWQFVTEEFADG